MNQSKRRSLERVYKHLKLDYFDLPKKNIEKGDVRALVGEKTWASERKRLGNGEHTFEAHVNAFKDALTECRRILERGNLQEELAKAKEEWWRHGGPIS